MNKHTFESAFAKYLKEDADEDVAAEEQSLEPGDESLTDEDESEEREELTERELEQMFDEMLDEVTDEIKIGKLTFLPSKVLKNCDEVAYREEYLNWLNNEVEEGNIVEEDDKYYRTDLK